MISANYIGNLFRTQRVLLASAFLFVGLFQVLMMILVDTLDLPNMLQGVISMLPAPAQQVFGDQFISDYSVGGIVALAYNHPLILVTLLMVAISLPTRQIAGAVENGTLELLLSMPVPRLRIARSLWLACGLFLLVVLGGCLAGTAVGMALFPETRSLDPSTVAQIGFNLWSLAFAISSYAFLISAWARESGRAVQLSAGITLVFYFLDYAVQIWPAIEALGPLSPFYYYDPQGLLRDGGTWMRDVLVLLGLATLTGIAAMTRVERRDVP